MSAPIFTSKMMGLVSGNDLLGRKIVDLFSQAPNLYLSDNLSNVVGYCQSGGSIKDLDPEALAAAGNDFVQLLSGIEFQKETSTLFTIFNRANEISLKIDGNAAEYFFVGALLLQDLFKTEPIANNGFEISEALVSAFRCLKIDSILVGEKTVQLLLQLGTSVARDLNLLDYKSGTFRLLTRYSNPKVDAEQVLNALTTGQVAKDVSDLFALMTENEATMQYAIGRYSRMIRDAGKIFDHFTVFAMISGMMFMDCQEASINDEGELTTELADRLPDHPDYKLDQNISFLGVQIYKMASENGGIGKQVNEALGLTSEPTSVEQPDVKEQPPQSFGLSLDDFRRGELQIVSKLKKDTKFKGLDTMITRIYRYLLSEHPKITKEQVEKGLKEFISVELNRDLKDFKRIVDKDNFRIGMHEEHLVFQFKIRFGTTDQIKSGKVLVERENGGFVVKLYRYNPFER